MQGFKHALRPHIHLAPVNTSSELNPENAAKASEDELGGINSVLKDKFNTFDRTHDTAKIEARR